MRSKAPVDRLGSGSSCRSAAEVDALSADTYRQERAAQLIVAPVTPPLGGPELKLLQQRVRRRHARCSLLLPNASLVAATVAPRRVSCGGLACR
jgi:hypothetical protein